MVVQRWTGHETGLLRRALRMTIAEFAEHLGVTTRAVDKWEARGAGIVPRVELQRALDTVLERADPASCLRYASSTVGSTPTSAGAAACDVASRVRAESGQLGETLDERRRALLGGFALVVPALGLSGRGSLIGRDGKIGASDVAGIESVVTQVRAVDYESGGGALCEAVGVFAESASQLLARPCSGRVRPALLAAVANARQVAGWVAFDTGHHSDAQRHWLCAERAAVAADDRPLAARVRYCQARQFQHLRHNPDALDTLLLAQDQITSSATPGISAMLHGARASSLAALGEGRAAVTALAMATAAFEDIDADAEPEWMRFYDRGELLAQYGRVYRDLARADPRHGDAAVGWVSDAIDAFGPRNVRSSVLNEVGLCSGLFLAGEPDEALAVGARVIDRARRLTSQRVRDRIRNLTRDCVRYAHLPAVAEFRHTVTALVPAA